MIRILIIETDKGTLVLPPGFVPQEGVTLEQIIRSATRLVVEPIELDQLD